MTRGLVRKNNLSDLPNPEQARANLGLATADYNRIKGLFTSVGVSNIDVQRIARSTGNFQQQINSINSIVSGIVPSLYVDKAGDTLSGTWTNVGRIGAVSVLVSGVSPAPSSDAVFTHDYAGGAFRLTAGAVIMNSGLTVDNIIDNGNVTMASGITPTVRIPVTIGNVPFFLEAG